MSDAMADAVPTRPRARPGIAGLRSPSVMGETAPMVSDDDTKARQPGDPIPLHELLALDLSAPAPPGLRTAEVSMPVRPNAFGFTANLHGGAVATLVDVACALAAARA